jgi:carbonic anhydrase
MKNRPLVTSQGISASQSLPPCSQGVSWNVLEQPITLSRTQLDTLHAILGNNNRPVQPLFNRQVVQDSTAANP